MTILGTTQIRTTSYHPQASGVGSSSDEGGLKMARKVCRDFLKTLINYS